METLPHCGDGSEVKANPRVFISGKNLTDDNGDCGPTREEFGWWRSGRLPIRGNQPRRVDIGELRSRFRAENAGGSDRANSAGQRSFEVVLRSVQGSKAAVLEPCPADAGRPSGRNVAVRELFRTATVRSTPLRPGIRCSTRVRKLFRECPTNAPNMFQSTDPMEFSMT